MAENEAMLGQVIGNYRIEKCLGEGAFAHVFLGVHLAIQSRVAIKILKFDQPCDMSEAFLNEARVVNHINHPNIVKIFDFGALTDGRLYLVMEYMEGDDFDRILEKNGKLTLDEMLFFVRQISSALDATHECDVVHQDLKPANMFVIDSKYGKTLKLLDFGVARLLKKESLGPAVVQLVGTPRYMSPEQAMGKVQLIGPPSDIYALGIIIYEMLAGQIPYKASTINQALMMHAIEPPTPIFEYLPDLPMPVWIAIQKSLAKDPAQRFSSAGDFYQELAEAVNQSQRSIPVAPVEAALPLEQTKEDGPEKSGPEEPPEIRWGGLGFNDFLREVRKSHDFSQNLRELKARLPNTSEITDRILLQQEMMIQYRHLGFSHMAQRVSRDIVAALTMETHALDPGEVQEILVQRLATELDLFPAPWFRTEILKLQQNPLDSRNAVRLRGILAQYESMLGHGEEAVRLRRENLLVQQRREVLKSEIPFTLCHLAWEFARAGQVEGFEKTVLELEAATNPEDPFQINYNVNAVCSGAVLLEKYQELWRFLQNPACGFPGAHPRLRDFFASSEPVTSHPQVTTLRALIRLCRRMGNPVEALRLGRRLDAILKQWDLTSWLILVCGIERDLASFEKDGSGVDRIRSKPAELRSCHQPACDFYPHLLAVCERYDGSSLVTRELEHQLDLIYY